jgi:hypothetical protein
MRKSLYSDSDLDRVDNQVIGGAVAAVEDLPNRLLTAFEVAEFVGCHEEGAPCILARSARFTTLRRERKEVSSDRRPRLDPAGYPDPILVNNLVQRSQL